MKLLPGRKMAVLLLALAAVAARADDAPTVSDAWARATPPGVDVGAAYLVITGGSRADRLVAASTPRAAMTHLHEVTESEGVAKMRAIESVPIPAGAKVTLKPKGTHVMFMGLDAPLVAGQDFPLTLRFGESAPQTVTVTVRAADDDGGAHAHH
jgi:copper(I)-binding protein